MPLKLASRPGSPNWWITGTIRGRRVRESTDTDDRALAEELLTTRAAEIYRAAVHGEPERARYWMFHDAAVSYLEAGSHTAGTKKRIRRLLVHFGAAASCADITQHALEQAAKQLLRPGHKPATRLREVVAPARAILRHAAERGGCEQPRLAVKVPATSRTEWLTPVQAIRLERAMPEYLRPLLIFLLGTGARFGEAARLAWSDVNLRDGRALLRTTKNGLNRWVPLCPRVLAALASISGREGHVFRDAAGDPHRDSRDTGGGGQVRSPWNTAARKAGLPGEWVTLKRPDRPSKANRFQATHTPHAMRHSWATWHYAMHRDLLRLRHDGGWGSTELVERYAHLAPDAIAEAARLWRAGPTGVAGTKQTQQTEEAKKTA